MTCHSFNILGDALVLRQFFSQISMLTIELIEVSVIIIQIIHSTEGPISL